ncbi:tRNA (guanosine(46)-N7)-methyltransferase TrmB [Pseudonocardia eucalypti]|uniref:tRNA (guanine-N(7)-)-methyltransferase n=1 Tax=Pseudonocardia eucalypti TaxID=648755 RepID=A0ABP9PD93_9PSEU|nr:tRNA (guanine-N7-)-methyltransferase [Pseudonocardia eucalypti]
MRAVVSFSDRRGRMTEGQQHAWHRWWPEYGRDLDELPDALDADGWFGRRAPLLVEIGSGMGESTAAMAAAAPEINYLAVEVYQPGLAQLLMRIHEQGLTNLRLVRGDAVRLLRERITPGSLHGLRVFFPDPWPKRKHHKRRIVQPDFAALAASRLQPGGTLHLATDWQHYADHMRKVCDAEPALLGGPVDRPAWRPLTKFEQRAREEGRTVTDLMYNALAPTGCARETPPPPSPRTAP